MYTSAVVLWVQEGSKGPSSHVIQTDVVYHELYGMACPASLQAQSTKSGMHGWEVTPIVR